MFAAAGPRCGRCREEEPSFWGCTVSKQCVGSGLERWEIEDGRPCSPCLGWGRQAQHLWRACARCHTGCLLHYIGIHGATHGCQQCLGFGHSRGWLCHPHIVPAKFPGHCWVVRKISIRKLVTDKSLVAGAFQVGLIAVTSTPSCACQGLVEWQALKTEFQHFRTHTFRSCPRTFGGPD